LEQQNHVKKILRKAAIMTAALAVLGVSSLLVSFIQVDYIIPWMQIGTLSISGYLMFNL
jgi:hypothetical protein